MTTRLVAAILIGLGPLFAIGACGGDSDDSISVAEDDAATADVAIDSRAIEDAALDAWTRDAGRADARAEIDAGVADAAKTANRCGGYDVLEFAGHPAIPGDSCGACSDGTIACIGSNQVACAGATAPPCPTPPVDAGPNACGGYGPLTFLSGDASIGDSCGECGQIQCASSTSLACTGFGTNCATDAGLQSTCTIPSAAYTATPPSPTLPAETRPTTTSTSSIALPAGDLAYDPYDGLLYASISSSVTQGNTIAKIDPMSASVLQTIYVGPSPTYIALSDDGQALWVVISGSSTIRRVDLSTFTAGASFALPPSTNVTNLQVLAGTEDSLAVTAYGPPSYNTSIVVYDSGTARPYGLRLQPSMPPIATASASLLFGVTGYPYGGINDVCVDDNGMFLQGYAEPPSYSYYYGTPVFDQGVLYNANGDSYDAQTATLLHTFPVSTAPALVAVDAKDVYFLTATYHSSTGLEWIQVTGFDRTTYASTATDLLLAVSAASIPSFTRWGRYGFAFLNGSQSIEIARSTIIPDMP